MAKKSIDELFMALEKFIEDCKSQTFSSNKIIVPRDELLNMIREIEMKIPSEVEQSNKVMGRKDAIIAEAHKKADEIVTASRNEAQRIVNESEIMKLATEQARELINQATAKAQEIVNQAGQEGDMIRIGALNYTNNVMKDLSEFTGRFLEEEGAKYQAFVKGLQSQYTTIETNRQQIASQLQSGEVPKGDGKKGVMGAGNKELSEVEKLHSATRTSAQQPMVSPKVSAAKPAATANSQATPQNKPAADSRGAAVSNSNMDLSAAAAANSKPAGNVRQRPAAQANTGMGDMPVEEELDELDELFLDQY